ncbi:hypothetical protein [Azospirillum sp. sgz302134]
MNANLANGGRTVTVVADASFDEDASIAGWGGWVVAGDRVEQVSGIIRCDGIDSTGAELAALGNVIALAVTSLQLGRGDGILVVSDCEHALNIIARAKPPAADRPKDVAVRDTVDAMTRLRGIKIHTMYAGRKLVTSIPLRALQHASDQTARAVLAEHRARALLSAA